MKQTLLILSATLFLFSGVLQTRGDSNDEKGSCCMMGGPEIGHMHMKRSIEDHPGFDSLPKEMQEKLKKIDSNYRPKMKKLFEEKEDAGKEVRKIMHKFPLDKKAVLKKHKEISDIKEKLLEMRLDFISEMQEAAGKENWEKMHDESRMRKGKGKGKHSH